MELTYHRGAAADVRQAVQYLERERPGLGREFRQELMLVEARILSMPFLNPVIERDVRRILMHRFQYSILYDVHGDVVTILAVAHHKRDPEYWRKRV